MLRFNKNTQLYRSCMGELGNNSTQSTAFSISSVFDFDLMTLRIRHFYYGCSLKFEIYTTIRSELWRFCCYRATWPCDVWFWPFNVDGFLVLLAEITK